MKTQHTPLPLGSEEKFLRAVAAGKHRKGSTGRLKKIVGCRERETYGGIFCFCCGSPISVASSTLEHVTPVSLGGRTVLDNLALSHSNCNEQRGNSGSPRAAIAKATGDA